MQLDWNVMETGALKYSGFVLEPLFVTETVKVYNYNIVRLYLCRTLRSSC